MIAIVKRIVRETPRVMTVVVDLEKPISFKTGQCMRWNAPDKKAGRLFSVASPGGENRKELWFTMRVFPEGIISSHIPQLKVGDTVTLQGPYGKFIFDDTDTRDIVLVAGGSGISVLRSILRHVIDNKLPNKIHLLFSVLSKDEIIYREELAELATKHPNFTYTVTVTDDFSGWPGRCGRINRKTFNELFGGYQQTFYICGPPAFMDCAIQLLKEAGVPQERIRIDRWVF